MARLGGGPFGNGVVALWDGACAGTSLAVKGDRRAAYLAAHRAAPFNG